MHIDLGNPALFRDDGHLAVFRHLRRRAPAYLQSHHPRYGNFWNVTRHDDILKLDLDNETLSAENSFLLEQADPEYHLPMFLAMDPPHHDAYRDAIKPFFTGPNLKAIESSIRDRARAIAERLPVGVRFDWVREVSCELTSQVLALMFDYPQERREQLIRWSDLATGVASDAGEPAPDWQARRAGMMECLGEFNALKADRVRKPEGTDLLSLLIHGWTTGPLKPSEFLGAILMLIVAGNDTTRNSITGAALAFHRHPEQWERLRASPALLASATAEIFRWQTPIAYMRRVARINFELHGKQILVGDKVVLWYASGNQDEEVFEDPGRFMMERNNLRRSLAFGFGIHRCLGMRLADLQLRILWEEMLARYSRVEVVGDAVPVDSNFVKGYASMSVRLHR